MVDSKRHSLVRNSGPYETDGLHHTYDVPNVFDPELQPTPESPAVLPDINAFSTVKLKMF